jgi:hypothetical protein
MNIFARSAVRLAEQPWKLLHPWVGYEKKVCGPMTGQPRTRAVSWAFPTIAQNRGTIGFEALNFFDRRLLDTRPIVSDLDAGGATGLN